MKNFKCGKCGVYFDNTTKFAHVFPDIPGLVDRCEPGETIPAGECPLNFCKGLVYPVKTSGGQDVAPLSDEIGAVLFTILLNVGDGRTFLETVQVLKAIPAEERLDAAIRRARELYDESEGIEFDETESRYPVIAAFDGHVIDISTGE